MVVTWFRQIHHELQGWGVDLRRRHIRGQIMMCAFMSDRLLLHLVDPIIKKKGFSWKIK